MSIRVGINQSQNRNLHKILRFLVYNMLWVSKNAPEVELILMWGLGIEIINAIACIGKLILIFHLISNGRQLSTIEIAYF